jgi:hypothetical protein
MHKVNWTQMREDCNAGIVAITAVLRAGLNTGSHDTALLTARAELFERADNAYRQLIREEEDLAERQTRDHYTANDIPF